MNKLFLIGWLTLVTFLACENDKRHSVRLLEAERLVDTRPDSALLLLERMGDPAGWPESERAWWALLKVETMGQEPSGNQADSLIRIATDYFEKPGRDPQRRARAWLCRARACRASGQWLSALEYYQAALSDRSSLLKRLVGRGELEMAGLLAEMNLFDEALAAQKRSLAYFSQAGDTLEMVRTYGEMASSYASLNEIDSLLVCLIRLDSLKAGLPDPETRRMLEIQENLDFGLRRARSEQEEYQRARRHVAYGLRALADGDSSRMALAKGCAYLYGQRYDSAAVHLERAALAPNPTIRQEATYFLARLNLRRGRIDEALHASREIGLRQDSLTRENLSERGIYHNLLLDYQTLIGEERASSQKKEVNSMVLFSLLLAVVWLGAILGNAYRNERKNANRLARRSKARHLSVGIPDTERLITDNEARLRRLENNGESGLDARLVETRRHMLEMENQKLRADEQRRAEQEERFKRSEIYALFTDEAAKPKEADWTLLLETIDLVYDDFATRFRQLSDRFNEKEIRTACLIKIGLPPAMIARRLFCTKTNISMIRRRVYEKIFGEKGSSEQCDQFIGSF